MHPWCVGCECLRFYSIEGEGATIVEKLLDVLQGSRVCCSRVYVIERSRNEATGRTILSVPQVGEMVLEWLATKESGHVGVSVTNISVNGRPGPQPIAYLTRPGLWESYAVWVSGLATQLPDDLIILKQDEEVEGTLVVCALDRWGFEDEGQGVAIVNPGDHAPRGVVVRPSGVSASKRDAYPFIGAT